MRKRQTKLAEKKGPILFMKENINLPISIGKDTQPPYYCMISCFSCAHLFETLWTVPCQAPLSMGFSWQEYWIGLPCPPPGDLSDPGIKPTLLCLLHCRLILYCWATGEALIVPEGRKIMQWKEHNLHNNQGGCILPSVLGSKRFNSGRHSRR